MKNFTKFVICYLLFVICYGCSLYRSKQKLCKVIYSEKLSRPIEAIAILPASIGFKTGNATEFVPLVKSPLVIENKSEIWSGQREEKMIVDRTTAEEISKHTSEHFYNIILKRKKLRRVVHPASVRNVMRDKKVSIGRFQHISDLNIQPVLEKLFKIADNLEVDALIISIINKCETAIVYKRVRSIEGDDFGEYHGDMEYFYKFKLEVGVFNASEKKICWIGEYEKIKSNRTPELEQNVLVAVVTNGFEKFFKKYLTEKIVKGGGPEYQCVSRIVDTLPF
ncbi:MAG: hypothetical protein JW983_08340 [Elusimicrobia bacterium]|nr:hypothetical protein [Elusimicrobiota bacterium]